MHVSLATFARAAAIVTSLVVTSAVASPTAAVARRDETSDSQVFDSDSTAHTLLAWFPPLTRPSGGEVYEAGSTQVASWNRELPIGFNLTQVGKYANLMLGYSLPDVLNYHLEWTLVRNVSLYEGDAEVEYTFPTDLVPRDSYFLALVGSSSNISPKFTIEASSSAPPQNVRRDDDNGDDDVDPGVEQEEQDEPTEQEEEDFYHKVNHGWRASKRSRAQVDMRRRLA